MSGWGCLCPNPSPPFPAQLICVTDPETARLLCLLPNGGVWATGGTGRRQEGLRKEEARLFLCATHSTLSTGWTEAIFISWHQFPLAGPAVPHHPLDAPLRGQNDTVVSLCPCSLGMRVASAWVALLVPSGLILSVINSVYLVSSVLNIQSSFCLPGWITKDILDIHKKNK